MHRTVLASSSPYRRALLQRLGIEFEALAPDCDETAVQSLGLPAAELAQRLARMKAESVVAADSSEPLLVVASDQVCALGSDVLGKVGSPAGARAQLLRMQGRSHLLLTAVCLLQQDAQGCRAVEFCDRTELHMRALSAGQIAAYVERDRPWDCAGSYKLELGGIALFERIDSADHTAVTGLPLLRLGSELRRLGLEIPPG